ncbi:zinc finger protein 746-like [Acyrthosiphon pisum]|uniref:C2H2-type domain-containing protein n=1 Tax=Acyrthosiphon pisum TaxID=7029 RepID=A0A8R2JQW6_ACYPI|nr:zinc finger protein 746-like [Acyrthosiphon pisum]
MFKCVQCPLVFGRKDSLVRHEITHTGIRFPCTVCTSTFNYKSCVNRHLKNIHGIVNIRTHLRPIPATPIITQPAPAQQVQIAPQIFVPDVPAGGSNAISDDDDILCMEAMDDFEDNDILCMKAMDAFEDTG